MTGHFGAVLDSTTNNFKKKKKKKPKLSPTNSQSSPREPGEPMSEELVASVSSLLRNRKKARELISAKLTGLVLRDDPHHAHRLKKETISKTYSAKLQAQLREPDPRALHLQNRSLLSLEPNPIDLEHMFFAAPLDRVLIWSNEILTSRGVKIDWVYRSRESSGFGNKHTSCSPY